MTVCDFCNFFGGVVFVLLFLLVDVVGFFVFDVFFICFSLM